MSQQRTCPSLASSVMVVLLWLSCFAPTALAQGQEAGGPGAGTGVAAPGEAQDARPEPEPPTAGGNDAQGQVSTRRAAATEMPSYLGSDILFWTTMSFAAVHIVDHVARNNHSGFPYTDEVTPGSIALNTIPFIYAAGLYFNGPLSFIVADALLLAVIVPVHIFIEPPSHLVVPWANGSNLLEVESGGWVGPRSPCSAACSSCKRRTSGPRSMTGSSTGSPGAAAERTTT